MAKQDLYINLLGDDRSAFSIHVASKTEERLSNEMFGKLAFIAMNARRKASSPKEFYEILVVKLKKVEMLKTIFGVTPYAMAAMIVQLYMHNLMTGNWEENHIVELGMFDLGGTQEKKYIMPCVSLVFDLVSRKRLSSLGRESAKDLDALKKLVSYAKDDLYHTSVVPRYKFSNDDNTKLFVMSEEIRVPSRVINDGVKDVKAFVTASHAMTIYNATSKRFKLRITKATKEGAIAINKLLRMEGYKMDANNRISETSRNLPDGEYDDYEDYEELMMPTPGEIKAEA